MDSNKKNRVGKSNTTKVLNYKIIAKYPLIVAIGFAILITVINIVGTNLEGKGLFLFNCISVLLTIIMPLFIAICLYCWQISCDSEGIRYRTILGEKRYMYSEIAGYEYNTNLTKLFLYLKNGKRIKISETVMITNGYDITIDFEKNNIPYLTQERFSEYVVSAPLGYTILWLVSFLICMLAGVGVIKYQLWWGGIIVLPLGLSCFYYLMLNVREKVIVTKNNIVICHLFKASMSYTWDDLKYVCWSADGRAENMELHFANKQIAKINLVWNNSWVFKQELDERHIKWR